MSLLDLFRKRSQPSPPVSMSDLEALRGEIRLLKLEWIETHDKIMHALDRNRKREAKLAAEKEPENGSCEPESMADLWQLARQRGLV